MYLDKGKLFVDTSIYGGTQKAPVKITHNEFTLRIPGWDRNFDLNSLEVVNSKKFPVFQFIYQTPYHIIINGIFPSPSGLILANDDGFFPNVLNIRKSFRIIRLFKYPSNQFLGIREKIQQIIPGPNLKERAMVISFALLKFAKEHEKSFEEMLQKENPLVIDNFIAEYDEKFGLQATKIVEEIAASGTDVGRLPSYCRNAVSPDDMKKIAERLMDLVKRIK
jgi:hypothetical protein